MTETPLKTAASGLQQTVSDPIGGDGYWTFILSNCLLACSAGLYWMWLLREVYRTAKHASAESDRCDYITVLGMRLERDTVQPQYLLRLRRAAQLYNNKIASKILIIGGITGANMLTEAQGGRDYLIQQGIAAEAIVLEDRSRHTLENLHNARSLYLGRQDKSIALISNRFLLARTQRMAQGLGIRHQLCAAEASPQGIWKILPRMMLEAYYIHWYQVGKLWAHAIRSEKSLNRIH